MIHCQYSWVFGKRSSAVCTWKSMYLNQMPLFLHSSVVLNNPHETRFCMNNQCHLTYTPTCTASFCQEASSIASVMKTFSNQVEAGHCSISSAVETHLYVRRWKHECTQICVQMELPRATCRCYIPMSSLRQQLKNAILFLLALINVHYVMRSDEQLNC